MAAPKQPMGEGTKAGIFSVVTVLYCLSPIDLCPEMIFGPFGLADDAIAVIGALSFVVKAVVFPKRPTLNPPKGRSDEDEPVRRKRLRDDGPRRKRRDWDDDEPPRRKQLPTVRVAKVLALPQATRVMPDVAETAAQAAVEAVAKGIQMTEQMRLALYLHVLAHVKAAL
jgi:hypothetical protein